MSNLAGFARHTSLPALGTSMRAASLSLAMIGRAFAVARERRALAQLDDAALADLGLTPERAMAEASRPFWDLPRGR